jgi:hypothetical protein
MSGQDSGSFKSIRQDGANSDNIFGGLGVSGENLNHPAAGDGDGNVETPHSVGAVTPLIQVIERGEAEALGNDLLSLGELCNHRFCHRVPGLAAW